MGCLNYPDPNLSASDPSVELALDAGQAWQPGAAGSGTPAVGTPTEHDHATPTHTRPTDTPTMQPGGSTQGKNMILLNSEALLQVKSRVANSLFHSKLLFLKSNRERFALVDL